MRIKTPLGMLPGEQDRERISPKRTRDMRPIRNPERLVQEDEQ
jgi:hypothetical protein